MHVVSRLRAASAVAAALLTLAGCATGPGQDKTVSSRRTVPVAAANAADPTATSGQSSGKAVDPAFGVEKLRLIDACKVMSKDLLEEFGTPSSRATGGNYTQCSNLMKDTGGKDLHFSLDIGYTLFNEVKKANKQLAGLRSHEGKLSSSSCYVSVVTQDNPPLGLRIGVNYKAGDPCAPGRKLLEGVIKEIKNDPPKYSLKKGSPVNIDPCVLPDQATIKEVVGDTAQMSPFGLHTCSWATRTVNLKLDFRQTFVSKDRKFRDGQTEVDLGNGYKGYQYFADGVYPTCTITVVLLGEGSSGETGDFEAAGSKSSQFDRCAKAQTFAKAVLPKLPKA